VRTRWQLLVGAVGALSCSVAIDVIGSSASGALVAEDSAKFLGILAWALYFVLGTRDIAESLVGAPARSEASRLALAPAMLAYEPRPGAILGKALEPLDSGTGLIKVLVMLR